MKITALESQKKDPLRVSVYVDGLFYCGVSVNNIAKYSLYVGKDVEEKTLENMKFSELVDRFFDRAISFLERSPKTERQVKQYIKDLAFKKKGKWFEELNNEDFSKISEIVLGKLNEYQYLNDKRYAELFISSRIRTKPRGKDILVMELISKGVSKDIALEVTNALVQDEYELLKQTYYKRYKEENITIEDRKKIDFLRRKGFNWDLIEQFINDESRKQE
jgi:regulatory protein